MLVAILSVLAAAFVLATCYALYAKLYLDPSRTRSTRQGEGNEQRAEFLDEDHGPVVDHPIWYINTVGLQPSIISSITIFEYKKEEGLVDGMECAVCLNEFEEDETLRLLPKCSHAFHIPCIDTWLRSHTNCPLCRAPIVVTTARAGPLEGGDASAGDREGTRIVLQANGGGSGGETGGEIEEFIRDGTEEFNRVKEKIQPLRRSVSLDSLSALKIAMAMENSVYRVESREDDWSSQSGRAAGDHWLVQLMERSSSSSDSGGRSSQAGSSSGSVIRSFSCSGELFSGRYNSKNTNSAQPL